MLRPVTPVAGTPSYPAVVTGGPRPFPRVSPSLLAAADRRCPRRLYHELEGMPRSGAPFPPARVRDALLAAVVATHDPRSTATPVTPVAGGLTEEEQAVLAHALGWYRALFAHRPGRLVAADPPVPGDLPRRQVTLTGRLDLVVTDGDTRELRQLRTGPRLAGDDPRAEPDVLVALLRLARAGRAHVPQLATTVDLLRGEVTTAPVTDATIAAAAAWLDDRLGLATRRADPRSVGSGDDCLTCGFFSGCPAHPQGANADRRREDLRPGVLVLTPTAWEDWATCRRRYRNRHLLRIPESDPARGTSLGLAVHRVLHATHTRGSCTDDAVCEALIAEEGPADAAALRHALGLHRRSCPSTHPDSTAIGHEVTLTRMHRPEGAAPFLAGARLDALWVHAGRIEVRDYKTGRVPEAVRDDPAARLAAWVTAPLAAARGLPCRVTYEALGPDAADPEPFEPDDDDLDAITAELCDLAAAIRTEERFPGVADPECCHWCGYRSICPDRAPGTVADGPSWPAPDPGPRRGYAAPPP